jgi:glycosyltransferase involved in cell wall biosynthesis
LRLAVVSPFVDSRHGTERALVELLNRLARDYRCEIHLFAQRVEDLPVIRWNSRHFPEDGAIFWHRVPSFGGPLVLDFVSWFFLNRAVRWAFTFFHHVRFDFVLSPGINCSDANVIIVHALFYRLRQLALEDHHVRPALRDLLRQAHRFIYYALLTRLERRIYTSPRATLAAVSPRTAAQISASFQRSDVRIIPNGVETSCFSPSERVARREEARRRRNFQPTDFVLLLIGNDWAVKGLATVLRAMALLPGLPLHLLVVGGESPQLFQQFAKTLGVSRHCLWETPVDEVRDFYAAADMYVSPSREDSFGLPVAEAMASGLPVITSTCAGISGLIRDGIDGFVLADPLDAATLARLFQLSHGQPTLRESVGNAAAIAAQSWTWDRNAASVWELLKALTTT